jgi:hypothetical protein
MTLYYNSEGDSKDFSPGDTSRFAEGYTFTSDPTAETTTTTVTPPPQTFQDTQIWIRDGKKYVVWQVPGQPFFMRYETTDEEINQFYSGRRKPTAKTVSDDVWTTSVLFGVSLAELPSDVIVQGSSPFTGFMDLMEAAIDARPWLETDEEVRNLWIQGLVEDRDITQEEWAATDWFETQTQDVIDWLVLSKARGIDDENLPADAKVLVDENRLVYSQALRDAGVTNVDAVIDENTGKTFGQWFGDMVTTGEFSDTYAAFQVKELGEDSTSPKIDSKITDWLEGKGVLAQTRSGYATVQNASYKWLGPLYGMLDSGSQAELAKLYRNAESPEVGQLMLDNRFKEIRKTIFPTSVYDENLTYEDIATPWRNFTFNKLGERMSETSPVFYEILNANDATKAAELTLIYGANNNNAKVLDSITDDAAQSLGVSPAGVLRGVPT